MDGNLIESKTTFSFHLDGDSEIDASLLSKIIGDMAQLTKISAKDKNPEAYLKMNVTAFKNGSFQIDFSAICNVIEDLFTNGQSAACLALTIITALDGYFKVKKHLKGKKAQSIEEGENGTTVISNCEGNVIIVPKESAKIIENVNIDQLVVNIVACAQEHNHSGGFSFESNNRSDYYSSNDLTEMSKPMSDERMVDCRRSHIVVELPIKSPVLYGRSKWKFLYKGKAIEASILDDDFLEGFLSGQNVRSGDFIKATLEIMVELDNENMPIDGTEKYSVIKVFGSIQHDFQLPMS